MANIKQYLNRVRTVLSCLSHCSIYGRGPASIFTCIVYAQVNNELKKSLKDLTFNQKMLF